MAEKLLPAQSFSANGLEATYYTGAAPTPAAQRLVVGTFAPTGDQFLINSPHVTVLHVKNGAVALNITIQTPYNVAGNAIADKTVNVPADTERFFGPYHPHAYGDPLKFAVDSIANVSIAVLRIR